MFKIKTNIIFKLIIYTFHIPLYLISLLVPKNRNTWIFGGWLGEKYSDSTKYLFEYINKNHPQIKAIWLSKNKETIDLIRGKGFKGYYCYSFYGYLYSALAKTCIVNQGVVDVNRFIPPQIIVNLWHGIPLKKIMYDDLINSSNSNVLTMRVKKIIFPFMRYPENATMMIACSSEDQNNFSTAFKIPLQDIKITGYPRNDALFIENETDQLNEFNVIYAPTHRREGKISVTHLLMNEILSIDKGFSSIKEHLHIKLHFYHEKEINYLEQIIKSGNLKNIRLLKDGDINNDIYNVLGNYDILITDYSSIYFDFLLTGKPIIFFPFDYEEYISKDRKHYYDYNLVTPGPKCKNWNEVLQWVENFKNDPMLYSEERKRIRDKFHKYQDGESTARVYNEIKKLIENESKNR